MGSLSIEFTLGAATTEPTSITINQRICSIWCNLFDSTTTRADAQLTIDTEFDSMLRTIFIEPNKRANDYYHSIRFRFCFFLFEFLLRSIDAPHALAQLHNYRKQNTNSGLFYRDLQLDECFQVKYIVSTHSLLPPIAYCSSLYGVRSVYVHNEMLWLRRAMKMNLFAHFTISSIYPETKLHIHVRVIQTHENI